jgi:AraC-like DNA-binding protein
MWRYYRTTRSDLRMAEARLYTQYKEEIVSNLSEQFDYATIMAVPS